MWDMYLVDHNSPARKFDEKHFFLSLENAKAFAFQCIDREKNYYKPYEGHTHGTKALRRAHPKNNKMPLDASRGPLRNHSCKLSRACQSPRPSLPLNCVEEVVQTEPRFVEDDAP